MITERDIMERRTTLQKKQRTEKLRTGSAVVNKKINNSIKLVNKQSKMRTPVETKKPIMPFEQEYYLNMYSWIQIPISLEYVKKCAAEWVEMARDNEVLLMDEYPVQKGIPTTTWYEWIGRCPELKSAQTQVKEMIAIRRERGAMQNKYNSGMVMRMQHYYKREWKEAEEWRSSLSAKNEAVAQQPIQVILERYPDSPLVPMKKVPKE